MARTDTLGHFLTDVAEAIRTKKGTSNTITASDFDTEIASIPSGGSIIEENDVNFYDYDGTIVASYSASDFLSLTAMPDNPTHEGLTAQGWNWTLADAQDYVEDYGKCNIGQLYVTTDGATKIFIELTGGRISPYLGFAVNGSATVDWGDNSPTEIVTGTSTTTVISTKHDYSQAGKYVISISSETPIYLIGDYSSGTKILNNNRNSSDYCYINSIKKVWLGNNVTEFGYASFSQCYNLESISTPVTLNTISTSNFFFCKSLEKIVIPPSCQIYNNSFNGCTKLDTIIFPNTTGNVGNTLASSCHSLKKITLPKTITSFGSGNFQQCNVLSEIVVPNAISTILFQTFQGCSSITTIKLPSTITNIGSRAFEECVSLTSLDMPTSLIKIDDNAFSGCYSAQYYNFSACLQIPTLGNTNAFNNIPNDCKIIVPDDLYEDWVVANNWSTYASYIIKKTDWDALNE